MAMSANDHHQHESRFVFEPYQGFFRPPASTQNSSVRNERVHHQQDSNFNFGIRYIKPRFVQNLPPLTSPLSSRLPESFALAQRNWPGWPLPFQQPVSFASGPKRRHPPKVAKNSVVNRPKTSVEEHFICPITLETLRDPVVDRYGHTYERKAILEWLKKNSKSPITQQPLLPKELFQCRMLKDFLEQHKADKEAFEQKGKMANIEKQKWNVNNQNLARNNED